MSKEIPCPKCGHVWLWADWKKDKDAFCPKGHGCASEDKIMMSDDLVKRLRERAKIASEEGNMTAKCDANYFEKSADRIEELESKLSLRTNLHEECIYLLKSTEAKLAKAVGFYLASTDMVPTQQMNWKIYSQN